MNDQALRVVVISDEEVDLAAVGEASGLTRSDEDVTDLFIDPLTAAVLIGGGLALGKFVLHVIDVYRGGVEIDLLKSPPTIKRNKELPFGWVVTETKDGKAEIDTKDEPKSAVERMVESILKLPIDATVETVKDEIAKAKKADSPGPKPDDPPPSPAPAG